MSTIYPTSLTVLLFLLLGPILYSQNCGSIEKKLEEFKYQNRTNRIAEGEVESQFVGLLKGTPTGILYSLLDPSDMDVYKTAYITHVKNIDELIKVKDEDIDREKLSKEIEGIKIAHQGIVTERELGNNKDCYRVLQEFTRLFVEIGEYEDAIPKNICNTDFHQSIVKDEDGYFFLEISPAVAAPCLQPFDQEKTHTIWGVLICYKSNGKQKVVRQDMTRKLLAEGIYTFRLSYAKDVQISNVSTIFFDATRDPSTYPPKNCE